VKSLIVVLWRFLTGAHMNGKKYNDATFWRDASPRYRARRPAFTWWRRKARGKRAAWRWTFMLVASVLALGFAWSASVTEFALLGLSPFITVALYQNGRQLLFVETNANGEWYWALRPATRRAIEMLKPKKRQPATDDIPLEYAQAVRNELSEDGEQPPLSLKLLMDPDRVA
jgi:hypothetical protein